MKYFKSIKKKLLQISQGFTNTHKTPLNTPLFIVLIGLLGLTIGIFLIRTSQDPRKSALDRLDASQKLILLEITADQHSTTLSRSAIITNTAQNLPSAVSQVQSTSIAINVPNYDQLGVVVDEDWKQLAGIEYESTGEPPAIQKIITIPFVENKSIHISDHNFNKVTTISAGEIESMHSPLLRSNTTDLSSTPNSPQTLDILFIADSFTNMQDFHHSVDVMSNHLLELEPFSRVTNHIRIHRLENTQNLGCYRPTYNNRLIICDSFTIHSIASTYPHDTIVVVHDSDIYGGSGQLGLAVTYSDVTADASKVMIHEFGHSFADLYDEYNRNQYYSSTIPPRWDNCSLQGCEKWQDITTDCHATCGYTNLYRPTYNDSLMRTLYPSGGFKFGPVSQDSLRHRLLKYIHLPADLDQDLDQDYLDYATIKQSSSTCPQCQDFISLTNILAQSLRKAG